MPRHERDEPLDYESEDELARIVRLAASAGIHYNERSDNTLLKWLLGIAGLMVVGAAGGAWTLSNQVAGLTAQVAGMQRQMDNIQRLVEPHYSITKENP